VLLLGEGKIEDRAFLVREKHKRKMGEVENVGE